MKIRIIIAFAVVFSATGPAFSSNFEKAKSAVSINKNTKCAISSFKQAFQNSKAVFVGEVLSEEKRGDTKTFEFKVEKYWKGAGSRAVEINVYETARYQAWFRSGERYLIYADSDENGRLRVGRCSRSREISQASEDLRQLGKGRQSH
jgi:hypothetical protein